MALKPYSKEWLEELCASSYSYAEVLRKAGRAQGGGSQKTLREKIAQWNIDITHFTGQRWQANPQFEDKYSIEELFTVTTKQVSNDTLKRYLLKYQLKKYVCEECGCNGIWRGKVLALQLHHKDGNRCNNTLTNLSFLCPNCHAITDSYGGRNNIGQQRIK